MEQDSRVRSENAPYKQSAFTKANEARGRLEVQSDPSRTSTNSTGPSRKHHRTPSPPSRDTPSAPSAPSGSRRCSNDPQRPAPMSSSSQSSHSSSAKHDRGTDGSLGLPHCNNHEETGQMKCATRGKFSQPSSSQRQHPPVDRRNSYPGWDRETSRKQKPPQWDPTSPQCSIQQDELLKPPVTLATLSELNLGKIVANPKLRHDINFETNLHFRPNHTGDKSHEKFDKAEKYWKALRDAFNTVVQNRPSPSKQRSVAYVQDVFITIRDILKTLVPDRDHEAIEKQFDVDLLLQLLENHQLDFSRLAKWLSVLLRTHCAPMRDSLVLEMVRQVEAGAASGDTSALVEGLKRLFGILEAMKLDIANHQIRSLQPLLLEDTVNFERKFLLEKIRSGQCDFHKIRGWYEERSQTQQCVTKRPLSSTKATSFFVALVNTLCRQGRGRDFPPHAFESDLLRLNCIRDEIFDSILALMGYNFCLKYQPRFFKLSSVELFSRMQNLTQSQETQATVKPRSRHFYENRLQHTKSAICLEIARQNPTCVLQQEYASYEQKLLDEMHSYFDDTRQRIRHEIEDTVFQYAKQYENLPLRTIMESWDAASMNRKLPRSQFTIHDIARRIAHIGTLHWRVWGQLVYEKLFDDKPSILQTKDNF